MAAAAAGDEEEEEDEVVVVVDFCMQTWSADFSQQRISLSKGHVHRCEVHEEDSQCDARSGDLSTHLWMVLQIYELGV